MGQKEGDGLGALDSAVTGNNAPKELDLAARLAIVQERLEGNGATNPNIVDTPGKLSRHGCGDLARAA